MASETDGDQSDQDSELAELIRNIKADREDKRETLRLQEKAEKRMVPRKYRKRF